MHDTEGVIRFQLEHADVQLQPDPAIDELIHWHTIMFRLGLVGRDPRRYGGYAYGNMSQRTDCEKFIISGTQTGGLETLTIQHYAIVDHCDVAHNQVRSHGPARPSSECMTHAAIYNANADVHAIVHAHSPVIWQHWQQLDIPTTAKDIAYGTPEMAAAVADCLKRTGDTPQGSIAMLGHEDGVITYAHELETASLEMTRLLACAGTLN